MAIAYDLESERVHELARELADLTGDTMIGGVEVALREALARRRPIRLRSTCRPTRRSRRTS